MTSFDHFLLQPGAHMRTLVKTIVFILLLSNPLFCSAMEQALFDSLIAEIKNRQYEKAEKFLRDKKESYKKDPEYYVILLNYAIHKGDQSQLIVGQGTPGKDEITLKDNNGQTAGFIGTKTRFNEKLIVGAIKQTQQAISNFKNRLDIHFGIVAVARQIKNWKIISEQLVDVLRISREIDNKWLWGSINNMDGNPENFMLDNVQAHAGNLYREESSAGDDGFRKISLALIKYYPDHVMGYANMGTMHAIKKEYEEAKKYYRQALKIAPDDKIVQSNLRKLEELSSNK